MLVDFYISQISFLSKCCQSNCNLMTKTSMLRHSTFTCMTCRLQWAMDSEHVVLTIIALLLLIAAIQKDQIFRFSVLNMYFFLNRRWHNVPTALLARRMLRRQASASQRRVVWAYPRPQGWFEEMYQNPVLSALWKNDFRVSKETFDYICQLLGPDLSRQNTRFRKAVALNKCGQLHYVDWGPATPTERQE